MRMKSGKELTKLEIIKRLNLMKIKYDSSIKGKNYYIDLYNKEILSKENQYKIKKELEKDQKYMEFLSNNLKLSREASLEISIVKRKNNVNKINKKYFFSDFNTKLCATTILCYNAFDLFEKKDNIGKKIMIPVNAFKKFSSAFIYPEVNSIFKTFINFINYVDKAYFNIDVYHYSYIIIFVCLLVILLYFCNKYRKEKNALKRQRSSFAL